MHGHTHGAGLFILIVICIMGATNIVVRTWSAKHSDKPLAKALSVAF